MTEHIRDIRGLPEPHSTNPKVKWPFIITVDGPKPLIPSPALSATSTPGDEEEKLELIGEQQQKSATRSEVKVPMTADHATHRVGIPNSRTKGSRARPNGHPGWNKAGVAANGGIVGHENVVGINNGDHGDARESA